MRIVYCCLFYFLSVVAAASTEVPSVDSVCDISIGADIIGLSVDATTQDALYCEYHFDEYQNDTLVRSVVKYINAENQEIAEKKLDYSFMTFAPNLMQRDSRQGELRAMTFSAQANHFLLEYQKNDDVDKKTATVDRQENGLPAVADAGFDKFVRENWALLLAEKSVSFSFLSPIHSRAIALTVKLDNRERCGGVDMDAERFACFTVKPKSSLLKIFAKPLFLTYDKSSRRLAVFSGVVNLVDDKGKPILANIHYWYKP